jgi:hypothetical protein
MIEFSIILTQQNDFLFQANHPAANDQAAVAIEAEQVLRR